MLRAQIVAGPGDEPLMVTMTTDKGEIVSTEVFVNAATAITSTPNSSAAAARSRWPARA